MRLGKMRTLLTDNAGNLSSADMSDVCKVLGVKKIFSAPRYPQGDGHIERVWQPVTNAIRAVQANNTSWVSALPAIEYAHNTAVHNANTHHG